MNQGVRTIIYPVDDLVKAKKRFTELLGVKPYADAPYYVGFKIGDQDIGLNPNGHKQGQTGPLCFYHVDDIKKSLQLLISAGAQLQQDINDVGGGRLVASVKDTDGNTIGILGHRKPPLDAEKDNLQPVDQGLWRSRRKLHA